MNLNSKIALVKEKFAIINISTEEFRNSILIAISKKIEYKRAEILAANAKDQDSAKQLLEEKKISLSMFKRLQFNDQKIDQLKVYLETVHNLEDPVQNLEYAVKIDEDLILERYSFPIGIIGVIFESRPEVVVQISALAIKSSNGLILKGGSEAFHTNYKLFEIINEVLQENGLEHLICLLQSRDEVDRILSMEKSIDLIIPRGSNQLVRYIQDNTHIPVLGHSEGICHVYVDEEADLKKAAGIVLDAKKEYPAVCNAMETLLVHQKIANNFLTEVLPIMSHYGVELRLDPRSSAVAQKLGLSFTMATEEDWKTEYADLILSIKIVSSATEAMEHINKYGSRHTDSIVTEDYGLARRFFQSVDSASVFHNASTRFSDGFVYGLGAEVGVSTNKIHARGPVGLEGLMTYKYFLKGDGHIKATYSGEQARSFLHQNLLSKKCCN